MSDLSTPTLWLIIVAIGIGTFAIRFSFIGLIGDRDLPPLILKLLRYTPVAVMPGLVAPLVVWPPATGGEPDLARLLAALVAFVIGWYFKSVVGAVFGGMTVLYLGLALL